MEAVDDFPSKFLVAISKVLRACMLVITQLSNAFLVYLYDFFPLSPILLVVFGIIFDFYDPKPQDEALQQIN